MGYGTESDGRSADSGMYAADADPRYASYRDGELSPVWAEAERLRSLLAAQGRPKGADRLFLEQALERQLPTLRLYQLLDVLKRPKDEKLTLFVILFPGEGKDNTGIKDLNDKILGYKLTSRFILCRQKAISTLFWQDLTHLPPKFISVGSDYKTAQIVGLGMTRDQFAQQLAKLDAMLVKCLRDLLVEAKKEAQKEKDKGTKEEKERAEKRLKAIDELDAKLKAKGYRFDFLFGVRSLDWVVKLVSESTFLLLTEALKGAGMARFMAKGDGAKTGFGRKVTSKVLKPDDKNGDRRGKEFEHAGFIKVIKKAGVISDLFRTSIYLFHIFIDKVWTVALFEYRRNVFVMNPDVIRDVRKKLVKYVTSTNGWRSDGTVDAQIELLELWLVVVNTIDIVKDFVAPEFPKDVGSYHLTALESLKEVSSESTPIKWPQLERVLTRDLRPGSSPYLVQGRASEFKFYASSSDFRAQIFFSMDVRDLGVHLALLYDWAIGEVEVQKYQGVELMTKTLKATDYVVDRMRVTYATVVATFENIFPKTNTPEARKAARDAFGGDDSDLERPGTFAESVHVMLGGDEIFVAAHPVYAKFVCQIVAELRQAKYADRPLDLRTGVAYSRATEQKDPRNQKAANWRAHDQTLGLATASIGPLKDLERAYRRMQRLIEKLEGNPKKKHLVAKYTAELEALGLMQLYASSKYGFAAVELKNFPDLVRRLLHDFVWNDPYTELVDVNCKRLDSDAVKALRKRVDKLEDEITKIVGFDNYHVDPPPIVFAMPPLVKKLIDWLLPPEKYPYDDPNKKKDKTFDA
jgi:hypothetical protein